MSNPLTFSTLACPGWSTATVLERATAFGYDGLEWRGGPQGHINPSASAVERAALRRSTADAGLMSLAVTAYSSFTSDDPAARQTNVADLKQYADLAADLGASYVRAFLGEVPVGQLVTESLHQQIAECLGQAATYAQSVGVIIAVEPHDDFVRSASVRPILDLISHPALKVIWDVGNTYGAGEEPSEGFENLGSRLAYVQIKDGQGRGEQWTLGPVGVGQVPLKEIIRLLLKNGYNGAFSVEWERAWHPELDPPEVALPHAQKTLQAILAATQVKTA